MSGGYREHRFSAQDGLRLYYRDYGDPASPRLPVLCLAGLTRNSNDFHAIASHLADRHRVIALDLRGRGESEYDPNPMNYVPQTYLSDIGHLLTVAGCHSAIVIGTSLGGLLAMAMAVVRPTAIAGVILNDIGPEVDAGGLARISGYVGKDTVPMSLEQAAETMRAQFGQAFPDYTERDWRAQAALSFKTGPDGTLQRTYDPRISEPIGKTGGGPPPIWPMFDALKALPVLSIRGALSDILSPKIWAEMKARKPDLVRLEVANRGHVPNLSEPECVAAIDDFLARHGSAAH